MDVVNLLTYIIVALVFIIFILGGIYLILVVNANNNKNSKGKEKEKKRSEYSNTFIGDLPKDSIYKFMDFDEIKDNMIIRKNRTQYVMIIQAQGVNYDLMSEQEKIAVEEGFVQFLNTLRFPIQFYVQTRSLNLKEIVEEYKGRVKEINNELDQIRKKVKEAQAKGNEELAAKLRYQEKRKLNILEYGSDISEYIGRMSLNKNVLQQKTYVIVSYYVSEFGEAANYSKEEIDNICFSELYTRSQSVLRSLASSEIGGTVLNSEQIAELLYIAYNRDDSELLQLSKALDAEYDALYSTSKDVLDKKREQIEEQLNLDAVELVTESIISADKEIQEAEKQRKALQKKAMNIVEEYKDQMSEELYQGTKKEIVKKLDKKAKEETATKRRTKKQVV